MIIRNARTHVPRTAPRSPWRTAIAAASAAALSLTSCGVVDGFGDDPDASPTKGNDITVGLLMPSKDTPRYEKFDYPIFEKRVVELTNGKGAVRYANAAGDAKRQNRQLEEMVADKVDAVVVDAVDSVSIASSIRKAKDAGIPVIAYDRLAQGPIDAYVSFDNDLVGEVQGRALVEQLDGSAADTIVMMNGSSTDPNAAMFKEGAMSELQDNVTIAKTYETKDWDPANAEINMEKAVAAIGVDNIAGVYAANDGIAGAVIDVLKTMGVSRMPPVTGQDADLAAVQRIVSGDQYMTVYKSYLLEASFAAEIAVAKVQDRPIEFDALAPNEVDSPTHKDIPAQLVQPVPVTQANIKNTVVKDGVYKIKQICTPQYAADCERIGLK